MLFRSVHAAGGLTLDELLETIKKADDEEVTGAVKGIKKLKKSESQVLSRPLEKPTAQKVSFTWNRRRKRKMLIAIGWSYR